MIWLLPKLWRGILMLVNQIRRIFSRPQAPPPV
jgi:hypothetical protein